MKLKQCVPPPRITEPTLNVLVHTRQPFVESATGTTEEKHLERLVEIQGGYTPDFTQDIEPPFGYNSCVKFTAKMGNFVSLSLCMKVKPQSLSTAFLFFRNRVFIDKI